MDTETEVKKVLESLGMDSNLPSEVLRSIDTVRLVETHYFHKKNPYGEKSDYRNKSIDFALRRRMSFSSSYNTYFEFMKRFVKVNCPSCNDLLEGRGGGGAGDIYHIDYKCDKCKVDVSLSGNPEGGFSMRFKEMDK